MKLLGFDEELTALKIIASVPDKTGLYFILEIDSNSFFVRLFIYFIDHINKFSLWCGTLFEIVFSYTVFLLVKIQIVIKLQY